MPDAYIPGMAPSLSRQADSEMTALLERFVASVADLARKSALEAVSGVFGSAQHAGTTRVPARAPRGRDAGAAVDQGPPRGSGRITDVSALGPAIVAHLRSGDGYTIVEIARVLRQSPEVVKRVLKKLIADGLVRHEGNTRARRYFAGSGRPARTSRPRRATRAGRKAKAGRKGATGRGRPGRKGRRGKKK